MKEYTRPSCKATKDRNVLGTLSRTVGKVVVERVKTLIVSYLKKGDRMKLVGKGIIPISQFMGGLDAKEYAALGMKPKYKLGGNPTKLGATGRINLRGF